MDGIVIIDKPKNYTSRDVVNIVGKTFKTKKVGHTGTLDPLATGVLVVCINKGTKLVELITSLDKEYIANFTLGINTDTLDSEGTILYEEDNKYTKEEIEKVLKTMIGEYNQEVPIYSAIKVNGKKLYEYARNNEKVELPSHKVNIYDLELLDINYDNNKTNIKVRCHVSKGTYIRSLGRDIASKLNTYAIMTDLRRTKQGSYSISNAISLDKLSNDNLISLNDCLNNYKKVVLDDTNTKLIKNGCTIDNIYNEEYILFITKDKKVVGLYKNNNNKLIPYKMFNIN